MRQSQVATDRKPAERRVECWACSGTGTHQDAGTECRLCEGVGRLIVAVIRPDGRLPRTPEEKAAAALQYEKSRVLRQDQVWYPKGATEPIPVEDMSLRYLRNVLAFLERRADKLKFSYEWSLALGPQPSGDAATDAFDSMFGDVLEAEPMTWLYEQPLVRRIDYLIKIEHDGPVQ